MRRTNALQEYLHKTTRRYTGGEKIDVEFGETPHIKYDSNGGVRIVVSTNVRKWIGKNVSEGREMRFIIDSLNHEVEHYRRTPKGAKEDFVQEHPSIPETAAKIFNIYEDAYIDWKRTRELLGLRRARADLINAALSNNHRHGVVSNSDEKAERLIEGMTQVVLSGTVRGFSDLEKDEQQLLGWMKKMAEEIRAIGGPDEEENIEDPSVPGDGYFEERLSVMNRVASELKDWVDKESSEGASEEVSILSRNGPDASLDPEGSPERSDNFEMGNEEAQDSSGEGEDVTEEVDEEYIEDIEDGSSSGWLDAPPDDIEEVQERYTRAYRMIRRKTTNKSDIEEMIEAREQKSGWESRVGNIEEVMERRDLTREIVEAFEELKNRDRWVPAREGGRVYRRNVVRLNSGDPTVNKFHKRRQVAELGDRNITVVLDMSGSMLEEKAKVALASIQKATEVIGDEFSACAYNTFRRDVVNTQLITAPSERFKPDHLSHLSARGKTPTSAGIETGKKLLQESSKRKSVMIVVTDGRANVTKDGTNNTKSAINESEELVRSIRAEGTKVIGLGVGRGSRELKLDKIFHGEYVTTEMNNIAQELVRIYKRQMDTIELQRQH